MVNYKIVFREEKYTFRPNECKYDDMQFESFKGRVFYIPKDAYKRC